MRHVLAVILVSCLFSMGPLVNTVRAAEFCWLIAPFFDIVKLSVILESGTLASAHGVRFGSTYTFPFSGTAVIGSNQLLVGGIFTGNLSPVQFSGSAALAETAKLSLPSGNGTGTLIGVDGKFPQTPTTWTLISCPPGPIISAADAGE
jgi:hypothetical protein